MESKQPFANLAPKAIVSCVHSALGKTKAKVDKLPAKVNTGHLLPSGDVKLYSATRPMAQYLLDKSHVWLHFVDPELVTEPNCYPVILRSVPATAGVESGLLSARILDQNNLPTGTI